MQQRGGGLAMLCGVLLATFGFLVYGVANGVSAWGEPVDPSLPVAEETVTGLIVQYEPGYSASDVSRDVSLATSSREALDPGADIGFGMSTLELPAPVSAAEARILAEQLQTSPGIAIAEPDYVIQLDDIGTGGSQGGADAGVVAQTVQESPTWGLDRIDQSAGLDQRYIYDSTGAGVSAYIIDTGIRATHSDFGGRVAPGADLVYDGRGTADCLGHGTHVAGTLGGATFGVAKGVTLVPVRVFGCSGTTTTSAVINGMHWVVQDHDYRTPAVLNLSLGRSASAVMDAATIAAIEDNISVSVASGNSGIDACLDSPARVEQAITVNASSYPDAAPAFSNYGRCTDIYAPGVKVVSASNLSDTATSTMNGTSMAAPHVAGVAARYLSVHPAATPAQVQAAILTSATPVDLDPGIPEDAKRFLYSNAELLATPGAPTNLTATPLDAGASVAFTAPVSDGGTAISTYEYSVDDGVTWTMRSPVSQASPLVIAGLNNGSTYTVRLRAVNAVGGGSPSDQVLVSPRTTAGAPTIVAGASGNGSASLAFTPPTSDGGAPISNYEYSTDDGASWITRAPASTDSPVAITGLANGRTYQLRLRAANVAGAGIPSASVAVTPSPTVPGPPAVFTVLPSDGAVSVWLTPPASDGGEVISNYKYSTDDGATWITRSPASAHSPVVITGLTNGTTYPARFRAVNSVGDGVMSAIIPIKPATVPSAPTSLVATAGDRSASVAFTESTSDGGAVITDYEFSLDDGANWYTTSSPSAASPLVIKYLTNRTTYQVRLRAVNEIGESEPSAAVTVTPMSQNQVYVPITPVRVADTRVDEGAAVPFPVQKAKLTPRVALAVPVAGSFGIPADAGAVSLNITVVDPADPGYLTVYPCGEAVPNASNLNYVRGQIVPNAVLTGVGTEGTVCVYSQVATDVVVDVNGYLPAGAGFTPMTPARVADTRSGEGASVPFPVTKVKLAAHSTLQVPVGGQNGVPLAGSVSLNVTAADPTDSGFISVYPCGEAVPNASNLNYGSGQIIPNAVVTGLGTDGKVCLFSQSATDVIVDVNGWFDTPPGFTPMAPVRVADTRATEGVDVAFPVNKVKLAAGVPLVVPVAGQFGVPADAGAVSLNVTVVGPVGDGYLTLYPCGISMPNVSNLNYSSGQTVPNAVLTGIGSGGSVCVYSLVPTDVIIDLNGWFPKDTP